MKYKNEKIKRELKKIIQEQKNFNLVKIIEKLITIYKINDPSIDNISYGYDIIEITVVSENPDISYQFVFDSETFKEVIVKIKDTFYYDTYQLKLERLTSLKRTFQTENGKIIYDYKEAIKNSNFINYKFKYQTKNLNTIIEIELNSKINETEEILITEILENKIFDILDLYSIIKKNIKTDKHKIKIFNYKNHIISEYVITEDDKLISCRKQINENEEERLIDYNNGKLTVTTICKPETNEDLKKIMKKIKMTK